MSEDDNEFIGMDGKSTRKPQPKPHQQTSIKVVVKLRPLLPAEKGEPQCTSIKEDGQTVEISDPPSTTRETVDQAFGPTVTQKQLFTHLEPTISKIGEGFNVTIFSYGQTGSGKTYTMFGSDWDTLVQQEKPTAKKQTTFFGSIESDENFAGLIPRSIHYLFSRLYSNRKNVSIYCSFLQLYNERLIDLLQTNDKPLLIHQNKADGIYVQNLCEVKVANFEECINLMRRGQRNRTVRQTSMNVKSSRSHTIFQFVIEEVFPDKSYRRTKLNLCDLAGSEKINKAEEMEMVHFKELRNINLSLTTLGKVIWSLSSRDSSVPAYRESKLTRLLQDSLGGNTFTTIVANVTSRISHIEETLNTLKFAQRAKQVRTEVFVKSYQEQPELQQMQKEIMYLRGVLKLKRQPAQQKELVQRVRQLEQENRRLRKLADEQLSNKLANQNERMKLQLERFAADRQFLNSPGSGVPSGNLTTLEHRQADFGGNDGRKLLTSQTIDKHSTTNSSHLPQLQSRYSNSSRRDHEDKQVTMSINQNIILRRLDMIERMKADNKDKLERKLRQLDKGNRTAIERLEPTKHDLSLSRNGMNRRLFKQGANR